MQTRLLAALGRLAVLAALPASAAVTFWLLTAPPPARPPRGDPPEPAGRAEERQPAAFESVLAEADFIADGPLAAGPAAPAPESAAGPLFPRLLAALPEGELGDLSQLLPQLRLLYGEAAEGFWSGAAGLTPRGRLLAATLARAAEEGLDPADYLPAALAARLARSAEGEDLGLELLLSAAILRYSQDVSLGTQPHPLAGSLRRQNRPTAWELARASLAAEDFGLALADLPPPHEGYRRLRAALAALRQEVAPYGWGALPPGPEVAPGAKGPQVLALRQRLEVLEGHPLPADDPSHFDAPLAEALRRVQQRFGLTPSARLDKATRRALDRSPERRLADIRHNMERWRALPRDLGLRHLVVNIPDFRLAYHVEGREVLSMAVAVGRPSRPTPVFSSELSALVLNPTWTVPDTIAREDLLPRIRRDPRVLDRLHMTLHRGSTQLDPQAVDWRSLSTKGRFPYRLVQQPGRGNALGRVKFQLESPYSVYLHDTPARSIFSRSWRAVSSGCVRLEEPERLAELLAGEKRSAAFNSIWRSRRTRKIPLREKIPIHFTYFTVFVDDSGLVQFRNDLYDRD